MVSSRFTICHDRTLMLWVDGRLSSATANAGSSLSSYTRARGRLEFRLPVKNCKKTKQVSAVDDCQRIVLRRKFLNLFFFLRER
jgi:hypothetical protein